MLTLDSMRINIVRAKRNRNRVYGVIHGVPPELIGKTVVILTKEEWDEIQRKLEEGRRALEFLKSIEDVKIKDFFIALHDVEKREKMIERLKKLVPLKTQ